MPVRIENEPTAYGTRPWSVPLEFGLHKQVVSGDVARCDTPRVGHVLAGRNERRLRIMIDTYAAGVDLPGLSEARCGAASEPMIAKRRRCFIRIDRRIFVSERGTHPAFFPNDQLMASALLELGNHGLRRSPMGLDISGRRSGQIYDSSQDFARLSARAHPFVIRSRAADFMAGVKRLSACHCRVMSA